MARCNLNLGWTMGLWVSFCLLVTAFSVFGVFYSSSTKEHHIFYNAVAQAITKNALDIAAELIASLRESALATLNTDPQVLQCNLPSTGFDSERLVRLFEALSTSSTRRLSSIGVLRYANDTATQNGKLSWQVAAGYGCPKYMYAFADPQIYNQFHGYCVVVAKNGSVVLNTTLAYNGTDWGLKPVERDLLITNPVPGREAFLPITPLLGYLTLTIEHSYTCGAQATAYAVVFAEQTLSQLDDDLQAMVKQEDKTNTSSNVIFFVERATGEMIAASVDGQTQKPDPNNPWSALRVKATEAPDATIAGIAKSLGDISRLSDTQIETDNWWILTSRFTQLSSPATGGIDWLVVTATPTKGFIDSLKEASATSIGVSLGIIIFMLIVTMAGVYKLIIQPLRSMSGYNEIGKHGGEEADALIGFDEIEHTREAFKKLNSNGSKV